jgi:hypothetical protein
MSSTPPRNKVGTPSKNGELLLAADAAGFEVLLTTDKNMRTCAIKKNLAGRKIAVVILGR